MSVLIKYKGQLYLLLLLIVLPWAAWSLTIKNTYIKWRSYNKEVAELAVVIKNTAVIQKENNNISSGEELLASGALIDLMSRCIYDNKLKIEKYNPNHIYGVESIQIRTAELVVAGDYKSVLILIDHIEQNIKQCKILSLNFKSTKDRRTSKVTLSTSFIIQQITEN